jgi:hypothetical protein
VLHITSKVPIIGFFLHTQPKRAATRQTHFNKASKLTGNQGNFPAYDAAVIIFRTALIMEAKAFND